MTSILSVVSFKTCFEVSQKFLSRSLMKRNLQIHSQQNASAEALPQEKIIIPESEVESDKKDPLKHHDFFEVRNLVTIGELFRARVHLGHKIGTLDDRMRQFVFGNRLGNLIIDLNQTKYHLEEALNFTAHMAYRSGVILFVSRNHESSMLVERTAKEAGEYAHTREWKRGLFTNAEAMFGGVVRLPDLVILLSTLDNVFEEHKIVAESAAMLIPIIGIVDTNSNPNLITYPIPGNDDSYSAIELYCRLFKEAIQRGKQKQEEIV